jgi:signal transduction histidine kinase
MRAVAHRSSLALALTLGLTLVLVLALGMGAVATVRYFRWTTEEVLRDYAALAADQLAPWLETRLAQRLFPVLVAARPGPAPGSEPPRPDRVRRAASPAANAVRLTFVTHGAGRVRVAGRPVEPGDTLAFLGTRDRVAGLVDSGAYFGLAWPPDSGGAVVVFDVVRDPAGAPTADTYGFTLPLRAIREEFAAAVRDRDVLPRSLARRVPADSLVGFVARVVTPPGIVLDRGFAPGSPFQAERRLRAHLGLAIQVSLDPAIAPRLLAVGVPRGQGAVFGALLTAAVLLLVLAAFLLRQDRRLVALREDFLTSVSHELRTPLAQIRLFADTLALDRVRSAAERDESLAILGAETRRLTHLVDNLLSFNRSERGVLAPALVEGDLAAHVSAVVQDFEPLAAEAGSRVVTSRDGPLRARFDPDALRRVVLNLLDNAVKYGPRGQEVRVDLSRRDGLVEVAVSDRGPGVPPDQRRRVWQRFWRGHEARARGTPGAGIGLAVVAELVRLHGGSVRVADAPGGGATFIVALPEA